MSSSTRKQRPHSLRVAGQRITAVLAAAALSAGSAVAIAPAAAADYPPGWTAPSDTGEVEILARPWLVKGNSYTAGETITANPGRWQEGATLSYVWLQNGRPIEGEHGLSLKLLPEHTWSSIQFEVTASLEGRISVTDYSVETLEIKPGPIQNLTAPTISGDTVPGAMLTLDPGTWTSGATLKMQWLRNGEIQYQTNNRYFLTEEDLGATISARVTGSERLHTPITAQTNPTSVVVPAEVEIAGSNIPGSVLTAVPGAWAKGRSLSYEWLIDGVDVGYNQPTYGIRDEDGGYEISVLVRGSSVEATSKPLALQAVVQSFDEPAVEGETIEGRTLTAVPGRWTENTALSYQWLRDGVAIPGATGATYRLVAADSGAQRMTVDITGTREGFLPLTRTSTTWAGPVTSDYVEIFEEAVLSGEPHVSKTLSVHPGVWTEGTTFTYQWYRNYSTPIPGATSSTYTLTEDDLNTSVHAVVRGSLADHKSMVSKAAGTYLVSVAAVANTKAPTVIGTPVLGTYLYADPGTWSKGAELSYQWYRDGKGILYAESNRLFMSDENIGTKLSVRITATLADHKTTSVYSAPSSVVAAPPITNTKAPALTGSAVRGQTLTVDPGTWTDKATLSYEWMRGDTRISGANGPAYTLGTEDVGKKISVKVTGYKSQHTNLTVATPASTAVVNPQLSALPPTVSGATVQGSTLTAMPGAWPAKTTFTYQWMRNGTPVSTATASTFKLTAADAGARMSVKITGSLTGYVSASATSAQTTAVTAPSITAPASVSVTGSLFQGQQLKAAAGTWTSGVKLGFQWYADGVVIPGADKDTLLLGPAQTGKKITVKITGTLDGAAAVSRTSTATAAVAMYEIKNTAKPVLTGTPVIGSALKVSAGTWTAGAALSYQWLRDGSQIPGAAASSYSPAAADLGKVISVSVTGAMANHKSLTVITAGTAKVAQPAVVNTAKPVITGSAVQGQTLTAAPGAWTKGAALSFQWKRDGKDIAGAAGQSYKLTEADFGRSISVKVTGKLAGYNTVSVDSAATAKITRSSVANTAKPVITGSAVQGQTLTAAAGTWTKGAALSFQWKRDGKDIAGAAAQSYKLTAADFGRSISVKVTGKLAGYETVSADSAATAKITRSSVANTAKPAITGTTVTGQTLRVSAGTWTKGAVLTYQWKADGKNIAKATASSYKLTDAENAKAITVTVTGTLADFNPASVTTASTAKVARPSVVNTVKPAVAGTPAVGQTLKATPGTWTKGAVFTYQWQASGKNIAGATAGMYKLTAADKGKVISVKVTATLSGHNTASAASAATAPVVQNAVANAAKPAVSGKPVIGQKLTAASGTWTKGAALSYQWKAGGKDISGARASSYTPSPADLGKALTVTVTATLADHSPANATSAATAKVIRPTVANTAVPKISGTAVQGQTLKATAGTWTKGASVRYQWKAAGKDLTGATAASYKLKAADFGKAVTVTVTATLADHNPANATSAATAKVIRPTVANAAKPAVSGKPVIGQKLTAASGTWTKGAALSYQWKAGGKDISGARASSYTPAPADLGKALTVTVTATLADHSPANATSAATAKVIRPTVANTAVPKISGTAVQGQTLKATAGTWTKGASVRYQWKAAGKDLAGASAASYKLKAADFGKAVTVTVTASLAGHEPLSVNSAATAKITRPTVANTVAPKLTGSAVSGSTLKVSAGTWTKGTSVSYKWLRNGAAIQGAVKSSYTATTADAGKTLSVAVTGTLADHNPRTITLRTPAAVKLPAVTVTGTPAITGTLKVGSTLKLSTAGKWTAGTKLTYQWMRSGAVIKGATGSTYKLASADKGKTITVKVTGSKTGHTTASTVSKKTAAVR